MLWICWNMLRYQSRGLSTLCNRNQRCKVTLREEAAEGVQCQVRMGGGQRAGLNPALVLRCESDSAILGGRTLSCRGILPGKTAVPFRRQEVTRPARVLLLLLCATQARQANGEGCWDWAEGRLQASRATRSERLIQLHQNVSAEQHLDKGGAVPLNQWHLR